MDLPVPTTLEPMFAGDLAALPLDADATFQRVDTHGNVFRPAVELRQTLPTIV